MKHPPKLKQAIKEYKAQRSAAAKSKAALTKVELVLSAKLEAAQRALDAHQQKSAKHDVACKQGADAAVMNLFTACASAGVNPGELIKELNTHGPKTS